MAVAGSERKIGLAVKKHTDVALLHSYPTHVACHAGNLPKLIVTINY